MVARSANVIYNKLRWCAIRCGVPEARGHGFLLMRKKKSKISNWSACYGVEMKSYQLGVKYARRGASGLRDLDYRPYVAGDRGLDWSCA